jgi:hypothetical protein
MSMINSANINSHNAQQSAWHDPVFSNPSDGIWYQARVLAMMTFIQPTIEDELIAHSLGVKIGKGALNYADRY